MIHIPIWLFKGNFQRKPSWLLLHESKSKFSYFLHYRSKAIKSQENSLSKIYNKILFKQELTSIVWCQICDDQHNSSSKSDCDSFLYFLPNLFNILLSLRFQVCHCLLISLLSIISSLFFVYFLHYLFVSLYCVLMLLFILNLCYVFSFILGLHYCYICFSLRIICSLKTLSSCLLPVAIIRSPLSTSFYYK